MYVKLYIFYDLSFDIKIWAIGATVYNLSDHIL